MLKPGTVEMNNGIGSAMVKHQGAHMGIIWGMLTASLLPLVRKPARAQRLPAGL